MQSVGVRCYNNELKAPPRVEGNGAVAQLGERRVRNAKVGSSILLGSTNMVYKNTGLMLNLQCPSKIAQISCQTSDLIIIAPVAQWIERPPPKGKAARSIRARGTLNCRLCMAKVLKKRLR